MTKPIHIRSKEPVVMGLARAHCRQVFVDSPENDQFAFISHEGYTILADAIVEMLGSDVYVHERTLLRIQGHFCKECLVAFIQSYPQKEQA